MTSGTLLIVSHVTHYQYGGTLYAYGPYAREIDIWADLFEEVRIAAPLRSERPPADALAFTRANIRVASQPETGGETVGAKLRQLALLPFLTWSLARELRSADVVHVRCPGNLGLLGVCLAPLFARYRIAKYAGQWTDYPGEAWTVRLQRAILRSRWWRAPVTVYGQWPGQPSHVVPFFTSIMTEAQMEQARGCAAQKGLVGAPRILYVGRLSFDKRVDVVLRALYQLRRQGVEAQFTIVGDGPARADLELLVDRLALADRVCFAGAVSFDRVLEHYRQADFLTLVSSSEGWPKAIAEAMAFGLVCVGSDRGAVPWLLGEERGLTVPVDDADALAAALLGVIRDPALYVRLSRNSAQWAQQFTLEGLREALRRLMRQSWQLEI